MITNTTFEETNQMQDGDEKPTVVILDGSYSSNMLKKTLQQQTKLHMQWHKEMELFYQNNSVFIPLEYCVKPTVSVGKEPTFQNDTTPTFTLFIFNYGENLVDALKDDRNYDYRSQLAISESGIKKENPFEQIPTKRRKFTSEIDSMELIPIDLRNNREFMMNNVKKNGLIIHYAHPDLLFDRELMLEAIRNNYKAFSYVPFSLRQDEQFVKQAVKANGDSFILLNREDRSRQDVFEIAILSSGIAFEKASAHLRNNLKDFEFHATNAISKYWKGILHIDPNVPYFSKLIEIVVSGKDPEEELVNSNLVSNKDEVMRLLDISHKAFYIATREASTNMEVVMKALNKNMMIVNYFSRDHLNVIIENQQLVLDIIQHPKIELNRELGILIIEKSTLENVRVLINRYPHLANMVKPKMIIDPYILRYLSKHDQIRHINIAKLNPDIKKEWYCQLGYLNTCSTRLNCYLTLQQRFEKSYPGLVIPLHRFGLEKYK